MPQGTPIDRAKVHKMMWEARDRNGKVKIVQKKFAAHLGLAPTHMNRVIRDFEAEGRLKKVGSGYRNIGVYVVRDPKDFTSGLERP